jgi:dolichyl-diphosphooligosaccharide--protein glycosyltransferase
LLVAGGADSSTRIADSLGVRYIVVTRRLVGSLKDHARLAGVTLPEEPMDRLAWRLLVEDGSGPARGLAPHARLLYEVSGGAVKVFEVVPGARLMGRGEPGEKVEVSLSLHAMGARAFVWKQTTRCDGDGRFCLVVPYPTEGQVGDLEVLDVYQVRVGGGDLQVHVTNEQVVCGEVLVL